MDYLNREAILAKRDQKVEDLELPDLGGKIKMRSVTMKEFLDIAKHNRDRLIEDKDYRFTREHFLVKVMLDADGKRLFEDGDESILNSSLAPQTIALLHQKATELSPIMAPQKLLDERAKNSSDPQTSSGSGSA